MIIQMVLCQICKDRSPEVGRANAVLHQTERRNFHNYIITASIRHFPIQCHQIIHHWCGIVSMQNLVTDFILNRSNQADQITICGQNVFNHICSGRLSVCTRNTDKGHFPFRMTEPSCTELSVENIGVWHKNLLFS